MKDIDRKKGIVAAMYYLAKKKPKKYELETRPLNGVGEFVVTLYMKKGIDVVKISQVVYGANE